MLRDFGSIVEGVAIAAAFTVAAAACSSSNSGGSAGCPAVSKDAGHPAKEAGCPAAAKEAGCPATSKEAGCPATSKEAGCPATSKEAGCPATSKEAGCAATSSGTAQTPPTGSANIKAWITTGQYKQWACEPSVHAARSPSPHGFNRICSNAALAADATGTSDFVAGAASVKELYTNQTDTVPSGYAVQLKTAADSAGGANWYWYEAKGTGVVADGLGSADAGTPYSICVSCHSAAGSGAANTPSPGARDFVFSP